jgi:DNA topoisomerase-6 subunit B
MAVKAKVKAASAAAVSVAAKSPKAALKVALKEAKTPQKTKSSKANDSTEHRAAADVIDRVRKSAKLITTSSTAEYFSKNLQQVGFSSPTKAVLTTLKEAMDNSLDACEDAGILPDIKVTIEKLGAGSLKNTDHILIRIEDNGPGIDVEDVPKVFGEYLASSKFGRGRCSRGQQGIGISAATTWAMQTSARGAKITTKMRNQRKALSCIVDMDLKNNKGVIREKEMIEWEQAHGTIVEFLMDGRIQLNGEGGILSYLRGSVLLNPHMTLSYNITDASPTVIERVTDKLPVVPEATEPHPHTMKLGEFISHAKLFGRMKVRLWMKRGFTRMGEKACLDLVKEQKLPASYLEKNIDAMSDTEFKQLFVAVQNLTLPPPPTNSVLSVGEDGLALSIRRLGDIDYFAVLSRKPMIADFKPVQIEVAIARLREKSGESTDSPVQVLRFANRVPLQFDKAACAIVKSLTSVNWRSYGLRQPKDALPVGPFIVAVSVVSPFIKFKNASKETIDGSDELVEEMRRALMQAGQRLSRYLKREFKADELEQRVQHIEQFGPMLVETLARIINAPQARKERATEGLRKILERDTKGIKQDLKQADDRLATYLEEKKQRLSGFFAGIETDEGLQNSGSDVKDSDVDAQGLDDGEVDDGKEGSGKKFTSKTSKKAEKAGKSKAQGKAKEKAEVKAEVKAKSKAEGAPAKKDKAGAKKVRSVAKARKKSATATKTSAKPKKKK